MAGALLMLGAAILAAFAGSLTLARNARGGTWRQVVPALLPLVLTALLLGYLVTKVVYEELYPCWFVDELYCDFSSTQYHDLFGWEF